MDIVRHVVNGIVFVKPLNIQDVVAKCGNDASVEVLKVKLIKNR